ncbi:MAG: sulfatase-like hydrolase/transferase, partial [Rhodospirillales bacterium]|nr:sulfatase-like hydrolase/transferase [Rhodospirillales bacterium]
PDSADWDPISPGSTTYKGKPKYFGDMVSYMDKLVGQIVSTLQQHGLTENTIVLFTGDNGTDKPIVSKLNDRDIAGAKGRTTDAGTRVPLIVWGPGIVKQGVVNADLVDFSDFLPTLCDVAGAPVPSELPIDGRSFLPQLQGKPGDPREYIYCWYSRNGNVKQAKIFARNQRYKLYRSGEFFDIANDVLEQRPLAEDEMNDEAMAIKVKLRGVLDRYDTVEQSRKWQ